ncbi:MAG TPA: SDR family oxidoreductase [Gemmatimonas sp.]|nr:SDR family oxidoreductase [Gemmatimonas sp.]
MSTPPAAARQLPLAERTVVVLGAAGDVGEGLVRQLARLGAHVIGVSRSAERLERLQRALDESRTHEQDGSVTTVVGDVGHEDAAMALRDRLLTDHGAFDAVVASLGGWRQGPAVTDTPLAVWKEVLDQSLTAHFLAARALLPVIADRAGASYTMVNGGAALRAVPGAGAMCVSAAAQRMLAESLAAEHGGRAVRVNALLLNALVLTRTRPSAPMDTISADDVGIHAAYLASHAASHIDGATVVLDHPRVVRALPMPFGESAELR